MMKNWNIVKVLVAVFVAGQVLVSCKTGNDVVSGKFIQKRKYTKGYHVNLGKKQESIAQWQATHSQVQEPEVAEHATKKPVTVIEPENEHIVPAPQEPLTAQAEPKAEKAVVSDFPGKGIFNVRLPIASKEVVRAVDEAQPADGSTLALISFIFGLAAIVLLWVPYLGLITPLLALLAIIFAIVGWDDGNTFAILGLVFGILYFLLFLIALLVFASLFAF